MDAPPGTPPARRPSWQVILIILLVAAGFFLTAYFGFRFYRSLTSFHHNRLRPGTTDVSLIQNWMTVPYIARAYRVPEETLWQGLGIPAQRSRVETLTLLDHDYFGGRSGAALARIKAIVSAYLAQHPPHTPAPLTTPTPHP